MFRRLEAPLICKTIERLEQRIAARFPEASLRQVATELIQVAAQAQERIRIIRSPIILLRIAVWGLLLFIVVGLLTVPFVFREWGEIKTVLDFILELEPILGASFFISALIVYLLSIERRIKRERALVAIHELRALAHIVDMHQLTKDPTHLRSGLVVTDVSPKRTLNEAQLARYFDYCSEMLSLISKVATLYVQDFPDHVAIGAVDEVENLTTGLCRKIWQKIMLLERG